MHQKYSILTHLIHTNSSEKLLYMSILALWLIVALVSIFGYLVTNAVSLAVD